MKKRFETVVGGFYKGMIDGIILEVIGIEKIKDNYINREYVKVKDIKNRNISSIGKDTFERCLFERV